MNKHRTKCLLNRRTDHAKSQLLGALSPRKHQGGGVRAKGWPPTGDQRVRGEASVGTRPWGTRRWETPQEGAGFSLREVLRQPRSEEIHN